MTQPKQRRTRSKQNPNRSGAGKNPASHNCRPKKTNKKADPSSVEISAEQIDPNSPEADAAVMKSLLQMATSGKYLAATMFWAKVRCGMQEKGREKVRQSSETPTIVIRTEGRKVGR